MKEVLLNLAVSLTLIALGFVGGYLYSQSEAYQRCDEVLNSDTFQYDAGDLHYIATGEKLTDK